MNTSSRNLPLLAALGLALAVGSVAAQDYPSADHARDQDTSTAMNKGMESMHAKVLGLHTMPATVNATDPKTGTVEVTAGSMALKVHFPPPAMASLKTGDQITLHMGYTKP